MIFIFTLCLVTRNVLNCIIILEQYNFSISVLGMSMTIGNEIKKIRISKGISQKSLAGNAFSRSYISQVERDAIIPSSKAIFHNANIFNISPYKLVDSKTIGRIMSEDEIFNMFLSARTSYLEEDYKNCIKVLPLVIMAKDMLDVTDLISAKVWLADSFYQIGESEKALGLCEVFLDDNSSYTRTELAIALKLIHIKGIINYDEGNYQESLSSFLTIEQTTADRQLDVDKDLLIDNLSRIQMLYESLGYDDKVDEYMNRVIELSKKFNMISKGTLRSINRYYRDNSTDSVEEMVDFYESLMETARFIGDTYRVSVLYSSIVELYLKHDYLSKLEESLHKEKMSILEIENTASRGYSLAFYHLFAGRYYVKLKEFDKALDCYTKAQELISDSKCSKSIKLEIDSLYNYAELYYEKGELESAKLYILMAENASKEISTTVRNKKIDQLKSLILSKINVESIS